MAGNIPQNLKYTKEHEWARIEGNRVVVGVTQHAQEALGDVVYVELPKVGSTVSAGKQFGVIESTKAVSDLFAPLSGKVVKVNEALTNNPQTVNSDPYGAGWIIELEPSDSKELAGLMDATAYGNLLKNA
ncbi:glycine cleavage system protein GcvH [Archangium sp.]|uniref:glycine cleavage system protein GcvH n=1 Tax=Archangium sp. TaxID=1872627 RepID=UPI002D44C399|nr:glycine cleavage system protein GcvH [Archangium sp.]HYO55351.1 glycine cleavage system protein GcvH [Archangium sp.]